MAKRDITLTANEISKVYESNQGQVTALADISFEVSTGEFLCIVGPSGCGKTTLLRILAGLVPPTTGQVYLGQELLLAPRREIGFVFQNANLMPWRSVLRNVTLPLEVQGVERAQARQRAWELIQLVGLQGFEHAHPHELSGGMQQRVAIARALVHDPAILLLDEPFGSLDAMTREHMNLELLRVWRARRKTVVMVTHSIQEAVFLADRVLVMTPRPGCVSAEFPISLSRPRQLKMIHGEAFGFLTRMVRTAIEQSSSPPVP